MPRPLLWPLILALSSPAVARAETSPAHDFAQQVNRTCADLLFSRPEGVMKAARTAKMAALTQSTGGKPAQGVLTSGTHATEGGLCAATLTVASPGADAASNPAYDVMLRMHMQRAFTVLNIGEAE